MSGGKGGQSKTTEQVQVPAWVEQAARENLAMGKQVSQLGYTPYYGPDVAAFSPMQVQAMQMAQDQAAAFGMAPQMNVAEQIPQAQQFAGGLMGYSSAPIYEQSLAALQANRPAQAAAMNKLFINPQASEPAYRPVYIPREDISQFDPYMNPYGDPYSDYFGY